MSAKMCIHWWWVVPDGHAFCKLEEAHDGHCEPDLENTTPATGEEIAFSKDRMKRHQADCDAMLLLTNKRLGRLDGTREGR